jgi:hypothetical protein
MRAGAAARQELGVWYVELDERAAHAATLPGRVGRAVDLAAQAAEGAAELWRTAASLRPSLAPI